MLAGRVTETYIVKPNVKLVQVKTKLLNIVF